MAMNCEGEYGHLIMQDLILPATHSAPEVMASYAAASTGWMAIICPAHSR